MVAPAGGDAPGGGRGAFPGAAAAGGERDQPLAALFGPEVAKPDGAASLPEALADFQAGRERLLGFLAELALQDWDRPAVHETMGATNMALQVQNLINHDREHLAEVHRMAQLWEEQARA